MRKIIFPAILSAVLALTLFGGCGPEDRGEEITRVENYADFEYLEIGSAFEAEITRSGNFTVVITADESLIDLVEVVKEGNTLKVLLNPRNILTDFTIGSKTLKVEITMPSIRGLELSGASKGTLNGFSSGSDFSLVVSGASSLENFDLRVGNADFEISGASKASGNLSTSLLDIKVSGASSVEITGTASDVTLDITGASKVDLSDIQVKDAYVSLSGASEATLNVDGGLNVDLSGASRLYFYGNPVMGNTTVSGASTIKHK